MALTPALHPQYLDSTGKVLSGGFLYTYQAGTTTMQATYADNLGTIANPNPIPLDASGSPSNASGAQIQVWATNNAYKICAFNSALVQQWCWDNVNSFQIINGVQNITLGPVTSDPSGSAGEIGYRSDIPCFRGFTTSWDCFVQLTTIQTLSNKTLISPTITGGSQSSPSITTPTINSVQVVNSPGSYISVANSVTGTVNNRLTKLVGGLAQFMATTDVGGSIGITVTGGGGSGSSATIQQSGQANCFFDNGTTAGDYVQISALTGGSCHDSGVGYPTSGQVIGRALVTSAFSATPLSLDLFSPEITAGSLGVTTGCTAIGPQTVSNNNAQQSLISCTIPANTLGAGSLLNVDVTGISSTASAMTITWTVSLGGGTPCSSATPLSTSVANNQPWNVSGKFAVLTAGAGGTANWSCEMFTSVAGGGNNAGPSGIVGNPTISVNTTVPNTLLIQVQMSVANAGNGVTAQLLKSVIY